MANTVVQMSVFGDEGWRVTERRVPPSDDALRASPPGAANC